MQQAQSSADINSSQCASLTHQSDTHQVKMGEMAPDNLSHTPKVFQPLGDSSLCRSLPSHQGQADSMDIDICTTATAQKRTRSPTLCVNPLTMESLSLSPRPEVSQSALREKEKKDRETFLIFIKILTKYLETHDAKMYAKAKVTIKEVYQGHKAGDPKFSSLVACLIKQLRITVGDLHWLKAHRIMKQFLDQRDEKKKVASCAAVGCKKLQSRRQSLDAIKMDCSKPKSK